MSSKLWSQGMILLIDAQGVGIYTFDYSRWLKGDTIANASVIAENANAIIMGNSDTTVQVRVESVTQDAPVKVTVTTQSGRDTGRTVIFRPTEQ